MRFVGLVASAVAASAALLRAWLDGCRWVSGDLAESQKEKADGC